MTARILTTDADAIDTEMLLPCPCCKGRCTETFSTGGRMSDWIAIPCPTCAGRGVTPATDEELALLDQITADIDAAIRADEEREGAELAATVADVATWMGVNVSTPVTAGEERG